MDRTITKAAEGFMEITGGSVVLLLADGKPAGSPVIVGQDPVIVGRGKHCHISAPDPSMSTAHCQLVATGEGVLVKDLGSTNGTYVNQVRLSRAGAVHLVTNARLRCGETWLDFRLAAPEQIPLSTSGTFGRLVGRSDAMRRIYAKLAAVAGHDVSVLVTGETGTGKELVAEAIHQASRRHAGPFVVVDCTTIPAALAESRLFGHEKGSFTGAVSRQPSPFVEAGKGTLFFDELGELPTEIQPKLLRALETRKVQAVGSAKLQPIDVRIVAATRRNMHAEMNAKRFREDLYFRFAQAVIEMPPLRERPEDVPDLVTQFFSDLGDPHALERLAPGTMERLQRYDWPGNVRELRNVILLAHTHANGGTVDVTDLLGTSRGNARGPEAEGLPLSAGFELRKRAVLDTFERDYFASLARETNGNVSEMARRSGLSRPTLRTYLERYRLRGSD